MTEPVPDAATEPEEPAGPGHRGYMATDPFLDPLLRMLGVAPSDTRLSLTVMTAGGIVTGNAVSLGTYERALVEAIRTANEPFGTALSVLDDIIDDLAAEDAEMQTQGKAKRQSFIYMTDATLLTTTGPHFLGLWTGRTDRIGGWSLGVMNV